MRISTKKRFVLDLDLEELQAIREALYYNPTIDVNSRMAEVLGELETSIGIILEEEEETK